MKKKVLGFALLALLIAAPALAQIPQVLSIVVNGIALQGKALFYKGRVYVAVEDIARATGGHCHYDPTNKTLQATIPSSGPGMAANPRPQAPERPWLKVVSEKKYVYANNAVVFATIRNTSKTPAANVEVSCTFRGDGLRELGQSIQRIPELLPGQSTTLEFRLFEQPNTEPFGPTPPEGNMVYNGAFTPISYVLKMDYRDL